MYCCGRLFQSLATVGEVAVLANLEKRYARLEKPLFILALFFHPMYAKIGRAIVDNGEVDVTTLTTWVNTYGYRWGHRAAAGAVSVALAIQTWSLGFGDWVTESTAFAGEACKYWGFVIRMSPATSLQPAVMSRRLLAQVAKQLLGALPNAPTRSVCFRNWAE
jgi:hypothetical protein